MSLTFMWSLIILRNIYSNILDLIKWTLKRMSVSLMFTLTVKISGLHIFGTFDSKAMQPRENTVL